MGRVYFSFNICGQLRTTVTPPGVVAIYAGFVLQAHDLGESYTLVATSVADTSMSAQTTFADGGVGGHTCAVTTNGGVKCCGIRVEPNWIPTRPVHRSLPLKPQSPR